MIIKDEILLHIGYHKTGTTSLQKLYFKNSNTGFHLLSNRSEISNIIVKPHSFDFNPNQEYSYFKENINLAKEQHLLPVISFERLVGTPFRGGYDSVEIANRLKVIFPNAKILIVIREQIDMILSTYNQYVQMGGVMSLKTFLRSSFSPHIRDFEKIHFCYHRSINYYQKLFGQKRVLSLTFEQFKAHPSSFLKNINTFCSLPTGDISSFSLLTKQNASLSPNLSEVNAKFNRFFCHRNTFNPEPFIVTSNPKKYFRPYLMKINEKLPANYRQKSTTHSKKLIKEIIKDFYSKSNQETIALTGIPLKQYGYML